MSKAKPARMDTDTDIYEVKGAALTGAASAPPRAATLPVPPAEAAPATASTTAPQPPAPAKPKATIMTPEEEEASWGEDYHRDPKTGKKTLKKIATTIAFPPSVLRELQARLRDDQEHNLQTLVFYALSKIGIEINPEYLTPKRRRWTR